MNSSIPDKTEFKDTTSLKFKSDLVNFFKLKDLNTCLEIGTNWGYTTYTLSHLFNKVYTIEITKSNYEQAKKFNSEHRRNNIEFILGSAYEKGTYKDIPRDIDAVFIDCVHTLGHVNADINTALSLGSKEVYLIFDDYGHPNTGVSAAIKPRLGKDLKPVIYLGEPKGYTFKNGSTTLRDWEGIICQRA